MTAEFGIEEALLDKVVQRRLGWFCHIQCREKARWPNPTHCKIRWKKKQTTLDR